MTAIEWTDVSWNPVTGCDRTSPGCDNCYALTLSKRLKAMGQPKYQRDGDPRTSGPGFGVTCHPDELDRPLRWREPLMVFVNSMSDLFHPDVPNEFIASVFHTMALAGHHTFQVLTKRPQRMAEWVTRWEDRTGDAEADRILPPMPSGPGAIRDTYSSGRAHLFAAMLDQWGKPPEGSAYPFYDWQDGARFWPSPTPNVWLGTSIENDRYAFRADHLRATPAAVRFLSLEPLLGPLPSLDLTGIDWVIVGGESGPGARPMHPDWARDIRDRCTAAGIPLFFKQWGRWVPRAPVHPDFDDQAEVDAWDQIDDDERLVALEPGGAIPQTLTPDRCDYQPGPGAWWMAAVGKKSAGRVLDGRTWDELPAMPGHLELLA